MIFKKITKHWTRKYDLEFKAYNTSHVTWASESFPLFCMSTGSGGVREGSKGSLTRDCTWSGSKFNFHGLGKAESQPRKTNHMNRFYGKVSGKGQTHKWKNRERIRFYNRVWNVHAKRRLAGKEGLRLMWSDTGCYCMCFMLNPLKEWSISMMSQNWLYWLVKFSAILRASC